MRGSEEKKYKSMKVQGTSIGSIFGGAKETSLFCAGEERELCF
jgi:hypothetical protein